MKNKAYKILSKLLVVVVSSLLFTSFSPSLDGRAVVVEEGVFPQGLFAKTVGYLPGDTISVTNVAGDSSVDLLVIGSLDPSEGVAIMVTPEAATAIGIDKSENNIVKITKRSGVDERVYGNAIITKSTENVDSIVDTENDDEITEEEITEEEITEEEITEETDDSELNEEEPNDEILDEEEIFDEEESLEEVSDEELSEEEIEEELLDEDPEEEILEETDEEFIEEEIEDFEDEDLVEETVEEIEEFEEDFSESESVDEEILEQVTEEVIEEEMFEDFEESEDALAEEVTEENVEVEAVPLEQEFVEADDLESLEEESDFDEIIEDDLEETDDVEAVEEEYEAIVLVPAESNPPVVEEDEEEVIALDTLDEITEETEVESVEEVSEAIILPEDTTNVVEEITVEQVTNVVEPTPALASGYEKYIVPSLNDLESGKYYIQIASLRDDKNIEEIISKYANNYPITIVPKKAGNIKQILVGPLSMDEYGVVLQRFKSYGYKDAFLRKIK